MGNPLERVIYNKRWYVIIFGRCVEDGRIFISTVKHLHNDISVNKDLHKPYFFC